MLNHLSFKNRRLTPSGCKYIGFEFLARTQFLDQRKWYNINPHIFTNSLLQFLGEMKQNSALAEQNFAAFQTKFTKTCRVTHKE